MSLVTSVVLAVAGVRVVAADPQPSAADAEATRRAAWVASFDAGQAKGQITVGALEDAILARNPYMQARYTTASAVHAVLDEQVRFELLAAEAERRGYGGHKETVFAQRQSAVQALIKHEFDDAAPAQSLAEADIRQYYDSHIQDFVRGEARRASLLLVRDDSKAQALLARAKSADVRAFRELVRSESADQTNKQRGGDLSYFDSAGRLYDDELSRIEPEIAKAAFALSNVGDTSGVVAIGENRGILRLTGIRPAQNEPFTKARESLRMRLWRERRQASIDAHVAALKQALNAQVHPELVDVVQLDTGDTANSGSPSSARPSSKGLPSGFPHIKPESQADPTHTGGQPR